MELQIIEGKIKALNPKDKNYGVLLENSPNWYSVFGKPTVQKGDNVKITYVFNDPWYNVKEINVVESNEQPKINPANEFEQPVEVVKVGPVAPSYSETQDKRQESIVNQFSIREALQMINVHNLHSEEKIAVTSKNLLINAQIVKTVLKQLSDLDELPDY